MFQQFIHDALASVATGVFSWVAYHVKKYVTYEFARKFAFDQVMAVEQMIGKELTPEDKREQVINYIHKRFPKIPLWIVSNLVEAAVKKMNQGGTNA